MVLVIAARLAAAGAGSAFRLSRAGALRAAFEPQSDSVEVAHAQDQLDMLRRPWRYLDRKRHLSIELDVRLLDERGPALVLRRDERSKFFRRPAADFIA